MLGLLSVVGLCLFSACEPAPLRQGTEFLLTVEPTETDARGDDPAAAMRATSQALARRLDLLGYRASCEVVSSNLLRARVRCVGRPAVTNLAPVLTSAGRLEFRLVHPDNDNLVQNGETPAGYALMEHTLAHEQHITRTIPVLVAKRGCTGLTGHIERASAHPDGTAGTHLILLELDREGTAALTTLTEQNLGRRFAIVLDGVLCSAPVIRSPITGGQAIIQGQLAQRQATELAAMIENPLPLPLRIQNTREF